tara:strand:+ start:85 stop:870 length:786 start_codon:yes stop_codon:yes gene_type:complete
MNIKIFGERNTGTTALEQNLKNNFPNHIFNGDLGIANVSKENFKYFKLKLKRKFLRIIKAKKEKIENNYDSFFDSISIPYQWKHCATNFSDVQLNEISKEKIHFLFTVREPLSWLYSLNKNRYHLLNRNPCSIEDFMNLEIEIWKRENLVQKKLKPLMLYEEKIKSYIKFIDQLKHFNLSYTVLRFEDLILNHRYCYERIAKDIGLYNISFIELIQSTKDKTKDLGFYKNYYGNKLWKKDISKELLNNINFDHNLMSWMGY